MIKLSKDFSLNELVHSTTAEKLSIKNAPDQEIINNLKLLAATVLQPARDVFGKPLIIHSGYRCEKLNAAVGGMVNSDHVKGLAADFTIAGVPLKQVFETIQQHKEIAFGQMIFEDLDKDRYGDEWIHISCGSKREALLAQKNSEGKIIYTPVRLHKKEIA